MKKKDDKIKKIDKIKDIDTIKKSRFIQNSLNNINDQIEQDDGIVGRKRGDIRSCLGCRRMFHYMGFGHSYCAVCKEKDEVDFNKVKDYIYECGTATALEVSEYTGVSLKTIELYLREGRLIIPEDSPIFIKCEKCREDIRSGRLCADCAYQLDVYERRAMEFDDFQIGEKPKEKKEGKMRYLTKDKMR